MDFYRVPLSASPACSAPMRCGAGSSIIIEPPKLLTLSDLFVIIIMGIIVGCGMLLYITNFISVKFQKKFSDRKPEYL